MLDFFLDEEENTSSQHLVGFTGTNKNVAQEAPKQAEPASSSGADVTASMDSLKKLVSADLVKQINGVYAFQISDASPADWYLDLKNGNGKLDSGAFDGKVNCTLTMKSDSFNKMISGSLKPTTAFMTGKLKIKGDMGLAMKLEKLMGGLKSKL